MQFLGYAYDAVWHGLLNPAAEPQTVGEMARHLARVHLPLYIGAAAVLVSTSTALVRLIKRSATGVALPIATGALRARFGRKSLPFRGRCPSPKARPLVLISILLLIVIPSIGILAPSRPGAAPAVNEETISFVMPDGIKLPGRIYKPAGSGPFPAVLILHGAGGVADEFFEWAKALVREGMVGIVYARRGYTLASGSGDRDAARQIMKNSDEVLMVVEQVKKLPLVDRSSVGLLGMSEGGLHAYIASYRIPDLRAVVGVVGIPDFVAHYEFVKRNFPTYPIPWMSSSPDGIAQAIGCQPEACPNRYKEISAVYNADKVQAPVLIIAAKRDLWTPGDASARFAEALKAAGKPYEFHDYDEGHLIFVFTSPEWLFARGPIADWLRPQLWSKKDARDAWAKVVTFLTAHLKK